MKIDAIEFASLLCSRLCHDVLSPVGALNNGMELLADETDPDMRQQCLGLLSDSTKATTNKLKFFRLAFGAAGGFADHVSSEEVRDALAGMFAANKRITLGWMVADAQLPKPAVKLLLNLALIAGEALTRGGALDVGVERHGGCTEIVIRANGERLVLDEAIRAALNGAVAPKDLTPRLAAAWMVHALAQGAGGQVQLSPPDAQCLLMGVVLPIGD